MTNETKTAVLSKLRAPVADERVSPPLPAAWGSAINDAGDGHVDLYSAEQMQEYTRAALANAPVAGEAAERLDAPAQVGGTRFGKGIHWSTVIQAAQRHHEYMQDPAREAERIAQAKKFQAWVAGDSAPQVGPVAGEAQERIVQMAVNRYRPVPDGKFSYKVVAGDGSRSLYTGTKDSCLRVAAKLTEAFLDGAFVASYAAPQASEAVRPNIPPAKPLPDLMMASYHEAIGWNACRAAMLQSAPQASTAAGEAVAHAVISYGRIQRLVVNEESAHEYAEQQRLNAEAAGWDAKAHVRPLVYGDAAPQASEAVRKEDVATVLHFIFEHFGKPFNACDLPGYVVAAVRRLEHAALSAQPAAEPLSNPKQFALTAAENIRTGAPYDDPAFEALCREHGIWGTAEAALCAVFWRQAGQQRADATDWSAIAAEAQVERDAARAGRDALIVERQQRAAGDERTAFEATYQADYDDPGAACEREHFGKGYRAALAAQSGAQRTGGSDE